MLRARLFVVLVIGLQAAACAVGECPSNDTWCEGDVKVTCIIDRTGGRYAPPVGRRSETDCRAEGEAIGVAQTCHEATTGQVACLLDPVTRCEELEPGIGQPCASEQAATTCASFQSGGALDGPFEQAFACEAGTVCVDGDAGGQCT